MVRWEDIHPNEQASLKERLAGRYSAPFRQTPWVEAPKSVSINGDAILPRVGRAVRFITRSTVPIWVGCMIIYLDSV